MNNKGFTVVELIAAFSITMVISVFLFELLIEVKDIFVETSIKTNIEEKTSIISKNIYNLFNDNQNTVSCPDDTSCTVNGYNISVVHSEDKKENDYIIIKGQKFTMPKDGNNYIKIENINLSSVNSELEAEGYLIVNFELTSDNLTAPYKYNTVFYYTR